MFFSKKILFLSFFLAIAGLIFYFTSAKAQYFLGWEYCTPSHPCSVGQGDCDIDKDCLSGLYCAQNVGAKYGQASSMDVCEKKEEK